MLPWSVRDPGELVLRRVSYCWWVLAASFIILFLNAGARLMIGVMVKPIIADFGWSRSEVSAAVFVNMVVFSLAIVVAGRLYDRFGPKRIVLVSSLLFSGGLILMAGMNSLWQFILYYGVISAAGLGGTTSPIFGAIVSKWFEKRRGTAISLAIGGTSLGQFALVPLFTAILVGEGWRTTMIVVGLLCLVVNVVLVLWVVRGDPEELGQTPYGRREGAGRARAEGAAGPAGAAVPAGPRSLTLGEAMHTASFWLFTVAMFVCGAADFLLTTHLVPMATDHGVPTSTAVSMLAWFGLLSLGGLLLAGPASDLIGDRWPMAAAFGLRVVLFLLVVRYQTAWSFWGLSLGFGLTFLVTAPLTTTLMGRMYGFANIGLLGGVITTVHHTGGGLWAYLGGVVFDATGSYTLAMLISAVASAVALVCVLLIREVRYLAPDEGEAVVARPGRVPAAREPAAAD
jgi:MFS family permease